MTRHKKPTAEQNAGRLARKTAEVLRDRRWVQGTVGHPTTGMCAIGAIVFTCGQNLTYVAGSLATDTISLLSKFLGHPITTWNDEKGRTKEDVIAMLEKFADEMDPQQI